MNRQTCPECGDKHNLRQPFCSPTCHGRYHEKPYQVSYFPRGIQSIGGTNALASEMGSQSIR